MDMLTNDYSFLDESLAPSFYEGRLIYRYISRDLTLEEEEELERWMKISDGNLQQFEDLTDDRNIAKFKQWYQLRANERRLLREKGLLAPENEIRLAPLIWFIGFCLLVGFAWYMLRIWFPIPENGGEFYAKPPLFRVR